MSPKATETKTVTNTDTSSPNENLKFNEEISLLKTKVDVLEKKQTDDSSQIKGLFFKATLLEWMAGAILAVFAINLLLIGVTLFDSHSFNAEVEKSNNNIKNQDTIFKCLKTSKSWNYQQCFK